MPEVNQSELAKAITALEPRPTMGGTRIAWETVRDGFAALTQQHAAEVAELRKELNESLECIGKQHTQLGKALGRADRAEQQLAKAEECRSLASGQN